MTASLAPCLRQTDRVKELTQNISDTRAGVTEVKSTIDGMRATRDSHMSQLTALKAQLREQNNRLLQVNQVRPAGRPAGRVSLLAIIRR